MRPLTLRLFALALFTVAPVSSWGDEFNIYDAGSSNQSFEVSDTGNSAQPGQTKLPKPTVDTYPDPVVDQPRASHGAGIEPSTAAPAMDVYDPWAYPAENEHGGPTDCDPYGFDAIGDGMACRFRGQPGGVPNNGPMFITAWANGGYTYNSTNPSDGFNTPITFNDFSNEYLLDQIYLSFGRAVNKCAGCWDLGGQVDLLYGSDYFFTTAYGLETEEDGQPHWNSSNGPRRQGGFTYATYGLAMPQLFGEVFAPVGSGVSVKVGHFYTPIGYENVRAPENFFYSHSYVFQYGGPKTHTGVLTDLAISSKMNLLFAYTEGWDNWEDINGKPNYLIGMTWCPSQVASLAFVVSTGSEDLLGRNNRTYYNLVYTRRMGPVTYILEHGFGTEDGAALNTDFVPRTAKWYGINQYLFRDLSPTLTAGMRVEWFRDQNNARVLGLPFESDVLGGNYVGLTMGFNWRPHCNVIFRPEIRYDYSDAQPIGFGQTGAFNVFTDKDQLNLAMDFIVKF